MAMTMSSRETDVSLSRNPDLKMSANVNVVALIMLHSPWVSDLDRCWPYSLHSAYLEIAHAPRASVWTASATMSARNASCLTSIMT